MTDTLPGISGPDDLRSLNQAFPDRYPFLLQSTAVGGKLGRFDILFAFPGESLVLESDGSLRGRCRDAGCGFLDALDNWWSAEKIAPAANVLPFHGGWFLYLGYELAAEIEPSLALHRDEWLPRAFAVRCPAAIVYDHRAGSAHLAADHDRIDKGRLYADIRTVRLRDGPSKPELLSVHEQHPMRYLRAVDDAKRYIEAGDIYQANLSRQWTVGLSDASHAGSVYAALCAANPAPFAGLVRWKDTTIISSSPERLLRIRDGEISTRPIAGTRRRGRDDFTDKNQLSELIAHPKERAEHVMLIDLERSDLGRVCEAGTVGVDEMMVLESYAHVHHIVSNVRGTLRKDVSPGKAIAAAFPGGTITGCPKIRCMEIIDEQEAAPRGAYTGSIGYLNRDGSLDLNILIRTMVKRGNTVTFRAGAGIVADSDPNAELDETRAKAEGMLRALDGRKGRG